jgi:anti-anti-sigma regulatory factor
MLRITVHECPGSLTLQLEGRLVGPWVPEAEKSWRRAVAGAPKPALRIDLTAVTMIDAAGKAFLARAHAQGAELIAAGCLMRAIVAELSAQRTADASLGGSRCEDAGKGPAHA